MSTFYLLFGDLQFPPGGANRWLERRVDPAAFPESADAAEHGNHPMSVADHIASFRGYDGTSSFVQINTESDRVRVRGALSEAEHSDWRYQIAPMIRVAQDEHATGEVYCIEASRGTGGERIILPLGGPARLEEVAFSVQQIAVVPAAHEAHALYEQRHGRGEPPRDEWGSSTERSWEGPKVQAEEPEMNEAAEEWRVPDATPVPPPAAQAHDEAGGRPATRARSSGARSASRKPARAKAAARKPAAKPSAKAKARPKKAAKGARPKTRAGKTKTKAARKPAAKKTPARKPAKKKAPAKGKSARGKRR